MRARPADILGSSPLQVTCCWNTASATWPPQTKMASAVSTWPLPRRRATAISMSAKKVSTISTFRRKTATTSKMPPTSVAMPTATTKTVSVVSTWQLPIIKMAAPKRREIVETTTATRNVALVVVSSPTYKTCNSSF